jgi:hypothetical protein
MLSTQGDPTDEHGNLSCQGNFQCLTRTASAGLGMHTRQKTPTPPKDMLHGRPPLPRYVANRDAEIYDGNYPPRRLPADRRWLSDGRCEDPLPLPLPPLLPRPTPAAPELPTATDVVATLIPLPCELAALGTT